MTSYIDDLRATIVEAVPVLLAMPSETIDRPAPRRWSPREILGHLVDSAANNHQRFVRAQFQDDLVFQGYAQDDWVAVQRYQDEDWTALVHFWAAYNRHLARVMSLVPAESRYRARPRHNLPQIGFRAVAEGNAATLDALMADYVAHLHHHLRQILGEGWRQLPASAR